MAAVHVNVGDISADTLRINLSNYDRGVVRQTSPSSVEIRASPEGNKGENRSCRLDYHSNGVFWSDDREGTSNHAQDDVDGEKDNSSQELHLGK